MLILLTHLHLMKVFNMLLLKERINKVCERESVWYCDREEYLLAWARANGTYTLISVFSAVFV